MHNFVQKVLSLYWTLQIKSNQSLSLSLSLSLSTSAHPHATEVTVNTALFTLEIGRVFLLVLVACYGLSVGGSIVQTVAELLLMLFFTFLSIFYIFEHWSKHWEVIYATLFDLVCFLALMRGRGDECSPRTSSNWKQNEAEIDFSFKDTKFSLASASPFFTSNGGYRREEKSHKHWVFFTMLSSSVNAIFFVRINQEQLYVLNALKIREK